MNVFPALRQHLRNCESCDSLVSFYSSLYEGLVKETSVLPVKFTFIFLTLFFPVTPYFLVLGPSGQSHRGFPMSSCLERPFPLLVYKDSL